MIKSQICRVVLFRHSLEGSDFMEPVISPWLIYAVHIFDKLYFTCQAVLVLSFVIGFLMVILSDIEGTFETTMRYIKLLVIIAVTCVIVLLIVPDKNTLIAMLAANYITPDNIKLIQGNIVDFVQQISNATQR